jgi:hypothetical protein
MNKNIITATLALAIAITFIACEEKKSEGGTFTDSRDGSKTVNIPEVASNAASKTLSSPKIKEMYPKFGREFNDKDAAEYQKTMEALIEAEWDYDKLTDKQRKFAQKHDIWETSGSYWDVFCGGDGCGTWYEGGGPDSVSASSYLKSDSKTFNYLPQNIHDFSFATVWVEGADGDGIGEYVTYYFSQKAPRITTITIANGYVKSEKTYRNNSRPKKLKMYIDDKPFAILNLEDKRCEQIFEFEPIKGPHWEEFSKLPQFWYYNRESYAQEIAKLEKLPKWTLKFEILEVYKGDKYDDTVISEIYFHGLDVSVYCFSAGTKILMADNSLKNIESILAGDVVKSYDFKNKKLIDSKVTKLLSATHSNLLKLKLADNEIVTTSDHPFWIDKNVWAAVDAEKANKDYFQKTKVESLKVGDKVFIPNKMSFSKIIGIENIKEGQITYTIELSESDNFIANGMLVKTETITSNSGANK